MPSTVSSLAPSPEPLPDERARLEREVDDLKDTLERATARLDSLRSSGPEPRGFLPGVLGGGLVVLAGVAWFAYLVAGVLAHDLMTTPATPSPFREDDLPAHVQALRDERDGLLADLARVRAEISTLTPWSWRKFFLGVLLLPVAVGLVVLVFVRA